MKNKLIIKGTAASTGVAEGKAFYIESGDEVNLFPEGAVIVTTITDPTMVRAMVKASAIVTDIGGITSHPAILSREMGIPCVVNTKEGTKKIRNGSIIRVDGTSGEVYELA